MKDAALQGSIFWGLATKTYELGSEGFGVLRGHWGPESRRHRLHLAFGAARRIYTRLRLADHYIFKHALNLPPAKICINV